MAKWLNGKWIAILLFLVACSTPKGRVRIEGKFDNLPQADLLLYSPDGGMNCIDTIHIVKGKFDYGTAVPDEDPHTFVIVYPNYSTHSFITHSGSKVHIEGDALSLANVRVEGADSVLPRNGQQEKSVLKVGKKFPKTGIVKHEKGTYLLIGFWAEWKHNSAMVNYNIRNALSESNDSLRAFTYSLDMEPSSIQRGPIEKDDTIRWKTYCDYKGWSSPLLAKLGVRNIPLMILVGPKGTILAVGYDYSKDIKPHLPKKTIDTKNNIL